MPPSVENKGLALQINSQLQVERNGRYWFLGIGINKYQHFTTLYNAVKDVKDFLKTLQEFYQFPDDNTLVHTLYDAQATRKNIIAKMDLLSEVVSKEDKIIIYYSGHGHLNKKNRGYWIPHDAEKDTTSNYIANEEIRAYVKSINSLHTLIISDSCFSGSIFVRNARSSSLAMSELEKHPSRWALCSGRHDEQVCDGIPGENSPFAESILYILRTNQAAKINIGKIVDHVIEQTRANYPQLPEGSPIYEAGHKGGQFVFYLKGHENISGHETLMESPLYEQRGTKTGNELNRLNVYAKYIVYLGFLVALVWAIVFVNTEIQNSRLSEKQHSPVTEDSTSQSHLNQETIKQKDTAITKTTRPDVATINNFVKVKPESKKNKTNDPKPKDVKDGSSPSSVEPIPQEEPPKTNKEEPKEPSEYFWVSEIGVPDVEVSFIHTGETYIAKSIGENGRISFKVPPGFKGSQVNIVMKKTGFPNKSLGGVTIGESLSKFSNLFK